MSKGTIQIDGELSRKFLEFDAGEMVKLSVICSIDSLEDGSVSLSILECDIDNVPANMDDALRRASNERSMTKDSEVMVRARIEPYPG